MICLVTGLRRLIASLRIARPTHREPRCAVFENETFPDRFDTSDLGRSVSAPCNGCLNGARVAATAFPDPGPAARRNGPRLFPVRHPPLGCAHENAPST